MSTSNQLAPRAAGSTAAEGVWVQTDGPLLWTTEVRMADLTAVLLSTASESARRRDTGSSVGSGGMTTADEGT